MKPIRIEATNFVSFEHFKYEFQDGVTALVGLNKTDDNQGSNGSGKALTMDADILTPNGFVKMREIKGRRCYSSPFRWVPSGKGYSFS